MESGPRQEVGKLRLPGGDILVENICKQLKIKGKRCINAARFQHVIDGRRWLATAVRVNAIPFPLPRASLTWTLGPGLLAG